MNVSMPVLYKHLFKPNFCLSTLHSIWNTSSSSFVKVYKSRVVNISKPVAFMMAIKSDCSCFSSLLWCWLQWGVGHLSSGTKSVLCLLCVALASIFFMLHCGRDGCQCRMLFTYAYSLMYTQKLLHKGCISAFFIIISFFFQQGVRLLLLLYLCSTKKSKMIRVFSQKKKKKEHKHLNV